MRKIDFKTLSDRVTLAVDRHLIPVAEKEIFHQDILFALGEAGLLSGLVFHGGTALRLCYGGVRYSEDLDFAGGRDFDPASMQDMKEVIEAHLSARYGLLNVVKGPKSTAGTGADGIAVHKWMVSIDTAPKRPDIPRQRIKLEVADVSACTSETLPILNPYPNALPGYGRLLVNAESLPEIMADKLLSLTSLKYPRYRDIWDLAWMHQNRVSPDGALMTAKLAEYRVSDFGERIERVQANVRELTNSEGYAQAMGRFLAGRDLDWALTEHGKRAQADQVIRLYDALQRDPAFSLDGPTESHSPPLTLG